MTRTPKPSGSPRQKKPRRDTDLTRRADVRDSADQFMVVCGSESTEYDYLSGFKAHFKRRNLSVKVAKKPGSPLQVVNYAAERWGGAGDEFDQVWCVLDVDEYTDLERAVRRARQRRIELAVSNPCFELWLLLHHTDHQSWTQDYDALKKLLGKYGDVPADKSVDFARHYGGNLWKDAVRRARSLAEEGTEHLPESNPATRMWRLALAITGEEA
ncbi:RloB domain-containing protein [Streptomyces sp. SID13726]|nr:RloB family protein [Streptomyces sp. SID13726]NEB03897.1 RloB domain-containing protein [Streptomyces sp. SID13726]